uniref:Uncharacterized protein n=1 Tax=Opuntia streptacantha TaxID=393608 RepID=A0A7C9D6P7_OPUST
MSLLLLVSSRLIGSLNAESMTSFVGTIFHLGMIFSTLVNRLITIGWGFTFSDILHMGATRTAPCQKVGSFLWSSNATAPPIDSPYKNLGLSLKSSCSETDLKKL